MGFKRVHSESDSKSTGGASSPSGCSTYSRPGSQDCSLPSSPSGKKRKETPLKSLDNLKIHIVPAKLDSKRIEDLILAAEQAGAILCGRPDDAEILVTEIGMRKRLERHVDWQVAVSSSCSTCRVLIGSLSFTESKGHRHSRMAF